MFMNNVMKGKPSDLRLYFAQYPQAFEKAILTTAKKLSDNERLNDPKRFTEAELERIISDALENEKKKKKGEN